MVETIFKVVIWAVVIAIVIGVLGTVVFSWTLDTSPYLRGLTDFLHVIYYILPIEKLSPIIFCFMALMMFRIVVAIIKTVWSLIPGKDG